MRVGHEGHLLVTSWPTGDINFVMGVRENVHSSHSQILLQVDAIDDVQPANALLDEMQQLAERYARMVAALQPTNDASAGSISKVCSTAKQRSNVGAWPSPS